MSVIRSSKVDAEMAIYASKAYPDRSWEWIAHHYWGRDLDKSLRLVEGLARLPLTNDPERRKQLREVCKKAKQ